MIKTCFFHIFFVFKPEIITLSPLFFLIHGLFLVGNPCFVTGWGASEAKFKKGDYVYKYPHVLQVLMMTILDRQTCESKYFPGQVTPHEFCAETKALGKSSCNVSYKL